MLEVSFNSPQCGWMSIGFADGASEFHTTTAHAPHEGALAELMRILTDLAAPEEKERVLKWNRDPEEFDFRFVRKRATLLFEIYQYPTDDRSPAEREQVFSHVDTFENIHAGFAATFEQLYLDKDTDDFEMNWRRPFPVTQFEEFKRVLATNSR